MNSFEELRTTIRECANVCAACAEESREMAHDADKGAGMLECAAECDRCEAACRAAVHDLGQDSSAGVGLAADACEACADECEQFDHAHCVQCAEVCRATAKACREFNAESAAAVAEATPLDEDGDEVREGLLTADARPGDSGEDDVNPRAGLIRKEEARATGDEA